MSKHRHTIAGPLALGLTILLLICSATATAHQSSIELNVPAQSAPRALNEFAAQAHVQLLFDYKALARFRTTPIKGRMNIMDALARLLKGTGYGFQRVNSRTFAIMPLPTARDTPRHDRPSDMDKPNGA